MEAIYEFERKISQREASYQEETPPVETPSSNSDQGCESEHKLSSCSDSEFAIFALYLQPW